MKKVLAITLLLCVLVAVFVSVGAAMNTMEVPITYRDIKITFNGTEFVPTDVDGESTEPFIMNGSTYVPVRAVADAVGLDVEWDSGSNTVVLESSDVKDAEIAKLKSQQIVSITPYTDELGVPRYVIANAACSVLPYVEDNYVSNDEFCLHHLLKVDRRFTIETADGNVETWLLVSAYDGGQISANSFYPAMRMAQIWIKEADTLPYDEETQKLLRYPIFVADGTVDADGKDVAADRAYTITRAENERVLLTWPGGTSHWVDMGDCVYLDA